MHHKEQHNKILAVIMLFVFIIQTTFTGYAENLIIDEPVLSDIIFIPGNGFPHMAERAAQLWKEGFAPLLLPSGRYSIKTGRFGGVQGDAEKYAGPYETEWDFLQDVLRKNGVPKDQILKEDEANEPDGE